MTIQSSTDVILMVCQMQKTDKYSKLDNNTAYGYIREIERKLGGKLNLETLEIEKQLEFKNGDVLFVKCDKQDFMKSLITLKRMVTYMTTLH